MLLLIYFICVSLGGGLGVAMLLTFKFWPKFDSNGNEIDLSWATRWGNVTWEKKKRSKKIMTVDEIEELQFSDEYADYIMAKGKRLCCNNRMLLELMEEGYLFEKFLAVRQIT